MRLTLDALAVLDAIDRGGSFAAAAETLHRVPSAITYSVQKLEQDLDVALFDRSGHRARLTGVGARLLEDGRHLLRAAAALEAGVREMATGWEAELRVAVADLIPMAHLFDLAEDFYALDHSTRLRFGHEVLGGVWDALVSGRADLAVGASGDGPASGGYATRALGTVPFVFVTAPHHPLARLPEPLAEERILTHRAVAAADTSRTLPPLTSGLLTGQDVLTVPGMAEKVEAHRRGLGVGYVPRFLVEDDLRAGRLVARRVESAVPSPTLAVAWRARNEGKALRWFLDRLEDPAVNVLRPPRAIAAAKPPRTGPP
jgi:DNA-binding transcriptional LysR family regulator